MSNKSGSVSHIGETPAWVVKSAIGRRAEQQDSAWAGPVLLAEGDIGLMLLVADGMGGATGGRIASSIAIDAFRAKFEAARDFTSVKVRLRTALDAANDALAKAINENRALDGMGTTFIGAVVNGRNLAWVSVGDSLLLRSSDGRIERLNEDHSLAGVLDDAAERGEISKTEAQTSNQRNVLRSALTGGKIAMIDLDAATVKRGAWLIAATDGALTLSSAKIGALAAAAKNPQKLAEDILSAITNDMPDDQDNVTLAVTRVSKAGGSLGHKTPTWATVAIIVGVSAFIGAVALLASMLSQPDEKIAPNATGNLAAPIVGLPEKRSSEPEDEQADSGMIDDVPNKPIPTGNLVPAGTPEEAIINPSQSAPAPTRPSPTPSATPPSVAQPAVAPAATGQREAPPPQVSRPGEQAKASPGAVDAQSPKSSNATAPQMPKGSVPF